MERNAQREFQEALWRSSGGFDLVLGPVILSLGGLWLDRRFDTAPIFMILLLVLGAIGAGAKVYYEWKHGMAVATAERDRLLAEAASLRKAAASGPPAGEAVR
ncbi:MAG: AtpZ/AtpI family protein [Acidimicrobiales bacterium]